MWLGEDMARRYNVKVMPVRAAMIKEIDVGGLLELVEGIWRDCFSRASAESRQSRSTSRKPVGGSDSVFVHATEKGCDIHNEILGK